MKTLYLIALVAFISVGLFGFFGFTTDHHSAFMSCLKSVTGAQCSQTGLPMAQAHANSYLNFTTAILTLFVLMVVVLFARRDFNLTKEILEFISHKSYAQNLISTYEIKTSLLFWLGLFEKKSETSPA